METEAKFRSFVENAPDGIFLTNRDQNYQLVNPAACAMTGYTAEEFAHMNIRDLVPAEGLAEAKAIRHTLHSMLEIMGHSATLAPSGEDALASLEAGMQPDIVILDMNMPGLGGTGTLPRLRKLYPTLPVLLATGRVDQVAADLVASHPFVTLMPKPFGMKELQQHFKILVPG